MSERLAWAEREGVTPPRFVREAAHRTTSRPPDGNDTQCSADCGQCVCGETRAEHLGAGDRAVSDPSVTSLRAIACRGLTMMWVAGTLASAPDIRRLVDTPEWSYLVGSFRSRYAQLSFSPPHPPPETLA